MATSGGTDPPPGNVAGNEGVSYANKVSGKKAGERAKLNVLDVFLERRENTINYNLSKEELAKLLFKKMAINPQNVLKIDTSGFGKIHIEFNENVKPETMINLPSFDIREGLRTKFYRPHHRKDTLVTISWMDLETPDNLVNYVFGHFGRVKSNVQWVKIKAEENESQLAKMLNNILSGERQIWMEIEKPIPSYAMIDGRKVKIYHPGQRRTCARCQKTSDQCPGQSNAKVCEQNGGSKTNLETVWNDILKSVGYVDFKGGENIDLGDKPVVEESAKKDEKEELAARYPNCDGIIISNLPEDITSNEIEDILNSAVLNSTDGISILQAESARSKLVKNVALEKVLEIVNKIDNKNYDTVAVLRNVHIYTLC
jgi:hypothetical protein